MSKIYTWKIVLAGLLGIAIGLDWTIGNFKANHQYFMAPVGKWQGPVVLLLGLEALTIGVRILRAR